MQKLAIKELETGSIEISSQSSADPNSNNQKILVNHMKSKGQSEADEVGSQTPEITWAQTLPKQKLSAKNDFFNNFVVEAED